MIGRSAYSGSPGLLACSENLVFADEGAELGCCRNVISKEGAFPLAGLEEVEKVTEFDV